MTNEHTNTVEQNRGRRYQTRVESSAETTLETSPQNTIETTERTTRDGSRPTGRTRRFVRPNGSAFFSKRVTRRDGRRAGRPPSFRKTARRNRHDHRDRYCYRYYTTTTILEYIIYIWRHSENIPSLRTGESNQYETTGFTEVIGRDI
jgi:hypothetical protein